MTLRRYLVALLLFALLGAVSDSRADTGSSYSRNRSDSTRKVMREVVRQSSPRRSKALRDAMTVRERAVLARMAKWEAQAQVKYAERAVMQSIMRGLQPLRVLTGAMPELTLTAGGAVSLTASGVAAFAAGYAIGTGAKYVLGKLGMFAPDTGSGYTDVNATVSNLKVVYHTATTFDCVGGTCPSVGLPGWQFAWTYTTGSAVASWMTYGARLACPGAYPHVPAPSGFYKIAQPTSPKPFYGCTSAQFTALGSPTASIWYAPVVGMNTGSTIFDGATPTGPRQYTAPTLDSDSATDADIDTILNDPDKGPGFEACMDYVMGDPAVPTPTTGAADPCGSVQGEPDEDGDPVQRPLPPDPTEVPGSCTAGGEIVACRGDLEGAGDWPADQVVETPAPDHVPGIPAGAIVETSPDVGEEIEPGQDVTIVVNSPAPDTFTIPEPDVGETYATYVARLAALGYVGTATESVLPESAMDPAAGPSAVVTTAPGPGSTVDVDVPINVSTNPPTAPPVGSVTTPPTGAASCGLTPPTQSLDPSPLTSAPWGTAFPLSVVPWLVDTISGTVATGAAPEETFTVFGWEIETGDAFAPFDGWITAIRSILAVSLWLGVAWFLYSRTLGRVA